MIDVALAGAGADAASFRAQDTLRHRAIPATVGRLPGATVAVTGETAGTTDFNHTIRSHLAVVFEFVLALVLLLLLLLVAFRSIAIPLKAVVLSLLSVGAADGILVAVFAIFITGHTRTSSRRGSAWRWRSCWTPRWSAASCRRRPWSCSASGTGTCRGGWDGCRGRGEVQVGR